MKGVHQKRQSGEIGSVITLEGRLGLFRTVREGKVDNALDIKVSCRRQGETGSFHTRVSASLYADTIFMKETMERMGTSNHCVRVPLMIA
jgi:hypothetical protein